MFSPAAAHPRSRRDAPAMNRSQFSPALLAASLVFECAYPGGVDEGGARHQQIATQAAVETYLDTRVHAHVFSDPGHADRRWEVIPGGDRAALIEDTQPAFVWAPTLFLERPR